MIDVPAILDLHRQTVARWHHEPIDNPYPDFLHLVCQQHQFNFRLWHEEDKARSPDAGDAEIAAVKRAIDRLNQQRNDAIEQLDVALIDELTRRGVPTPPDAPRNSETPGSIIDRLSILALRIYHMQEQADRTDAAEDHRRRARQRLEILHLQQHDLAAALARLGDDLAAGRLGLRVYRQFKMYNDPTLNPYLYQAKSGRPGGGHQGAGFSGR